MSSAPLSPIPLPALAVTAPEFGQLRAAAARNTVVLALLVLMPLLGLALWPQLGLTGEAARAVVLAVLKAAYLVEMAVSEGVGFAALWLTMGTFCVVQTLRDTLSLAELNTRESLTSQTFEEGLTIFRRGTVLYALLGWSMMAALVLALLSVIYKSLVLGQDWSLGPTAAALGAVAVVALALVSPLLNGLIPRVLREPFMTQKGWEFASGGLHFLVDSPWDGSERALSFIQYRHMYLLRLAAATDKLPALRQALTGEPLEDEEQEREDKSLGSANGTAPEQSVA